MLPAPLRPEYRRWLLAAAAVLGGIFALCWIAVDLRWEPVLDLDETGRSGLYDVFVEQDALVVVLKGISRASTAPVYAVIFLGVLAWLLSSRRWRLALFTAVGLVGYALSPIIKEIVERPRPAPVDRVGNAGGFSFPSGHATQATIVALLLLSVLLPLVGPRARQALVALAAFCAIAIGFSRLGLGVHYVSDVVGGYALGAAWVCLLLAVFAPYRDAATSMVAEPSTRSPA